MHGFIHGAVQQLRTPDLGDGAFDSILFDALANLARSFRAALVNVGKGSINHAHRAIHQGLTGVDTNGDVGNFFFDQAKLRDALAESLALFRIADGVLQRGARAAHAARAQLEAANVEDVERDHVALADLAQQVLDRYVAIVQDQRAS